MVSELSDVRRFLRDFPPFDLIGADDLDALVRSIVVRYAATGDVLLEPGSDNAHLFIVRSGAVELRLDDQLRARIGEGQCFAYPSLLRGCEVRHRTVALEDCLLYLVPAARFYALRDKDERFAAFFDADERARLRAAVEARASEAPYQSVAIGTLVSRDPVTAHPRESVEAAVKRMAAANVSTLLVCDSERMVGIFSDKDLRNRIVAADRPLATPLGEVMTPNPTALAPKAGIAEAMASMTAGGFRHLPIVDGDTVMGVIGASDILARLGTNTVDLGLAIARASSPEALVAAARRIPAAFTAMWKAGHRPDAIMRFTSALGTATARRAARLVEERLGPAPVPFAFVMFGSLARGEQLVGSDQDNGLIIDDGASEADLAWFANYGAALSDLLHESGFVYCPGGIMAKESEQRLTLAQWKRRFASWIDDLDEDAILRATIYFDMAGVHGDLSLVERLKADVLGRAGGNPLFLSFLARDAQRTAVPLGFFRQFVLEEGREGKVFNAKKQAILPIIDIVRTQALAKQIAAASTLERISALKADGALAAEDAENLHDAFLFVSDLRIADMARALLAGEPPDHEIAPAILSPLERAHLKDVFAIISRGLDALRRNYAGGIA